MRTAVRSLVLSVPLLAAWAVPSLAGEDPAGAAAVGTPTGAPLGSTDRRASSDAWPDHALPDEDAARRGRAALPFTQDQIETLGRLLRETQRATARGAGLPPQGRVRRVRLDGPGDGTIPGIELRRGYTTVISFTDSTGAPWPIAEALVDRRFLPPGTEGGAADSSPGSGHLLYLAPQVSFLAGNAVVKLAGLDEPVVAGLRGTGGDADFRVEIRLGIPGPNASPDALARPPGFHAGDAVLLGLLGGTVPPDAERVTVAGGAAGDRAWRRGADLLLVTRAHLLSPGPLAAERGSGGRWAYRLAGTPHALVSAGGREARLSFTGIENAAAWPEADHEN